MIVMEKINGAFIRKKREEAGYSLREFAEMIYASKSSLLRWEQTFAPASCVPKIAEALGLSAEELYTQAAEYGLPQNSPQHPGTDLSPKQRDEIKFCVKGIICCLVVLAIVFFFMLLPYLLV